MYIEDGIADEVVDQLRTMGHKVEVLRGFQRLMFGKGQIIWSKRDQRTGGKVLVGGSDPRGDGQATGW